MRKFSADVDRAIENNGAVTLPRLRAADAQRHARMMAWVFGAAIISRVLLRRRTRS
jgi:hypothetical protein